MPDSDPYPTEEGKGGAAFEREVAAWEKRHQQSTTQNTGPARQPSATGGGAAASKSQYDLSGYNAGAIAEAEQIISDYGGMLGWPSWYNADAMVKRLLEQGLQNDTTGAFKYLWALTPEDAQKSNPNAFFGLTKQQYTEKLNSLLDTYSMYIGDDQVSVDLRNKALSENWTQGELLSQLQKDPTLMKSAPWAAIGLSYRDVQAQYGSTYGHVPDSSATLASWWKFRTGAQQVGTQGLAQQTFAQPPPLVSRPLSSDVETR